MPSRLDQARRDHQNRRVTGSKRINRLIGLLPDGALFAVKNGHRLCQSVMILRSTGDGGYVFADRRYLPIVRQSTRREHWDKDQAVIPLKGAVESQVEMLIAHDQYDAAVRLLDKVLM